MRNVREAIAEAIDEVYCDRISPPDATERILSALCDVVDQHGERMTEGLYLIRLDDIRKHKEEQPQWWAWNVSASEWTLSGEPDEPFSPFLVNMIGHLVIIVHGTTVDRNEKRDALLDAARKAHKPQAYLVDGDTGTKVNN